jgi:hypothetical protein
LRKKATLFYERKKKCFFGEAPTPCKMQENERCRTLRSQRGKTLFLQYFAVFCDKFLVKKPIFFQEPLEYDE